MVERGVQLAHGAGVVPPSARPAQRSGAGAAAVAHGVERGASEEPELVGRALRSVVASRRGRDQVLRGATHAHRPPLPGRGERLYPRCICIGTRYSVQAIASVGLTTTSSKATTTYRPAAAGSAAWRPKVMAG